MDLDWQRLPEPAYRWEVVSGLMQEAGLSIGSTLNEETVTRLRAAAKATDEHLRVEMSREENGGAVLVFIAR